MKRAKLLDGLEPSDPNFEAELTYEGYRTIEESDNDAYSSRDLVTKEESEAELTIEDREEDLEAGEENLVDPQENRK